MVSRRKVLKNLALAAVGSPLLINCVGSGNSEKETQDKKNSTDFSKWGFLKPHSDFIGKNHPIYNVKIEEMGYPPVGPVYFFRGEGIGNMYREALPQLKQEILKNNLDTNAQYNIGADFQAFVVPDKMMYGEQAIEYFKAAFDFLYNEIEGLNKIDDINYIAVQSGDDLSEHESHNHSVIVGHGRYGVTRVVATDINDESKSASTSKWDYLGNGTASTMKTESDGEQKWYITISSNNTAIQAPFAELLPVAMGDDTFDIMNEVGHDNFNVAMETVTEGMAYHLGHKIAKELNIPDGTSRVDERLHSLINSGRSEYRFVPSAINYISGNENGIQRVHDMWAENPMKCFRAIHNYK